MGDRTLVLSLFSQGCMPGTEQTPGTLLNSDKLKSSCKDCFGF